MAPQLVTHWRTIDGSYVYIFDNGHYLVLDAIDVDAFVGRLLHMSPGGYWRYTERVDGKRRDVFVHKVVLERMLGSESMRGLEGDHINRCPGDCRRSNLRPCTRMSNCRNRSWKAASGYFGVSKYDSGWGVRVNFKGKSHFFGTYVQDDIAAIVSDYVTWYLHESDDPRDYNHLFNGVLDEGMVGAIAEEFMPKHHFDKVHRLYLEGKADDE